MQIPAAMRRACSAICAASRVEWAHRARAAARANGPPEPMPMSPSSGSMTSPVPDTMNDDSASATASSASRRRSTRSIRQSLASSTAALGRFPRCSSSLASNFPKRVNASAAAPAKPASTRSWYTFRTFRAPAFTMVWPMDTWPSPARATRPRWRTQATVVAWNAGAPPFIGSVGDGTRSRRARVSGVVHLHEVLGAHVGVTLGGREPAVPEQLLDEPEVGALAEHVGGEGVAKGVGRDPPAGARLARLLADDAPDAPRGQAASTAVGEERSLRPGAERQVGVDRRHRDLADRDHALLVALAEHANGAGSPVEVRAVEPAALRDPDAGGVEQLQQRVVAPTGLGRLHRL